MEQEARQIKQHVIDAIASGTSLEICAGRSKAFYGRNIDGEELDVSAYCGVVNYEPTELFITVKAGTPLKEIKDVLVEKKQMLAFEPPEFSPKTTIGGVVATGMSGPGRPYRGSVRDFILGIKCINGLGQVMSFGGEECCRL